MATRYEGPLRAGMRVEIRTTALGVRVETIAGIDPTTLRGEHARVRLESGLWTTEPSIRDLAHGHSLVRPADDDQAGWKLFLPSSPAPILRGGFKVGQVYALMGSVMFIARVDCVDTNGIAWGRVLAWPWGEEFPREWARLDGMANGVLLFDAPDVAQLEADHVERALAPGWAHFVQPQREKWCCRNCTKRGGVQYVGPGSDGPTYCAPCAGAKGAFNMRLLAPGWERNDNFECDHPDCEDGNLADDAYVKVVTGGLRLAACGIHAEAADAFAVTPSEGCDSEAVDPSNGYDAWAKLQALTGQTGTLLAREAPPARPAPRFVGWQEPDGVGCDRDGLPNRGAP